MKKLSAYLYIFRNLLYHQFLTDELFKLLSLDQFLCADEKHERAVGRSQHTVNPAEGDAVRGHFHPFVAVHLGVVPSLEPVGSFLLQHI